MSSDGQRAVSGAGDKTIHVWDVATCREAAALTGHTGKIFAVRFFPNGRRVASASQDKTVRVWDLDERRAIFELGGHTKQVTAVAVSPDGKQIASASGDCTVWLWNAQTGRPERVISLGSTPAAALVYSAKGDELFFARGSEVRGLELSPPDHSDQTTIEALFDAVWAVPAVDGPRAVLADALSERGDPRGEFITLQLARSRGEATVATKKRERELLLVHQREWVGPIAPLIDPTHVKFERGFVVSCALEAVVENGSGAPRHRAWSTVREFSASEKAAPTLVEHLLRLGAKQLKR